MGYALAGLQYKWHNEKWSPFVRGMLGAANISPDCCHGTQWRFAGGGGGGLDYNLSHRISLRLIQADYIYSSYPHIYFSNHPSEWNSVRLAAGVVFNFGSKDCNPVPKACTITATSPSEVWAGELVRFSTTGTNFNAKDTLNYGWKTTGGKISSTNTAATEIDTAGLAPGTYTVTSTLADPKVKKLDSATCTASFVVKAPPPPVPPTVQCVPPETTIKAGESATVQMVATNPDKRPLIYSWTTTAGQVVGSGDRATVTPSNNDAGHTITVTGTVVDDRKLTASCTVQVTVPHLPPPCVTPVDWGECTFVLNPYLPARIDNACKDTLDRVALDIQGKSSGNLVIVGSASEASKNPTLGPQRAQNAKYYLTTTGATKVDGGRIETRQGAGVTDEVHFYYVPDGTVCSGLPDLGSAVDEEKVQGHDRGKLPKGRKKAEAAK